MFKYSLLAVALIFVAVACNKKEEAAVEAPAKEVAEEAVVVETEESPSEEKSVEEIVSSVKEEKQIIPNTSSTQEISLVEKISAAFNKNSVKINR
jgi:hypothetical protein